MLNRLCPVSELVPGGPPPDLAVVRFSSVFSCVSNTRDRELVRLPCMWSYVLDFLNKHTTFFVVFLLTRQPTLPSAPPPKLSSQHGAPITVYHGPAGRDAKGPKSHRTQAHHHSTTRWTVWRSTQERRPNSSPKVLFYKEKRKEKCSY